MIEIVNGQIFIDSNPTSNPELIGLAMLDFAETTENDSVSIILTESDVLIDLNK